jgi:flavin reductase (DIM6/NTAB) family NADH-FMN oxidoreductase RutF
MVNSLINENNFPLYIISTRSEEKKFAMVATWVMVASLRQDELRFTLALSKYNDSARAILKTRSFNIHTISESEIEIAYIIGSDHSSLVDKFTNIPWGISSNGIPYLRNANAYSEAEVISEMETEDRYIIYCRCKNFKIFNTLPELTQSRFLSLLSNEKRNALSEKYQSDCKRDTPIK